MNTRFLCAASGMALSLSLVMGALAAAPAADVQPSPLAVFKAAHPTSPLYYTGQRVTTVYGTAFSRGATPTASAGAFVADYASMFGVEAGDLVPGSLAADGAAVSQLMPDLDDGHLRFTMVSYLQTSDGIPVFRGDLRLLVRNEAGFPLVLARSGLRPLGEFVVDPAVAAAPNIAGAFAEAALRFPGMGGFTAPGLVVWAGTESVEVERPVLAVAFEGTVGAPGVDGYEKWLVVADAATGAVLFSEDQVLHVDVNGTVKGMATPGKKADICATEVSTNMPYARVSIGSTVAYADANGAFTIPNAGSGSVSVSSGTRGRYFRVYNSAAAGADPEVINTNVTPPGPVTITHNQPNTNATHRSGTNAYIQANTVRDYTLGYSPTYPGVSTQTEWRVNINVSGTCNAYYDGSSINFYAAGGGCPSTAFGDVVWHEYGHHLVNQAGSGQGQYGEGQSDVMGVLISDEPILGYGFQNNCNAGIRTANNTKQYPQTGEIHDAGQLISGCVWSTRNALIGPYPSTHRAILGSLAVNSILLHAGDLITPQITIDYLTLDDDNADIGDGTPHRTQIHAGFGAHNMPAPALTLLKFDFPQGKPATVSPSGGAEFTVQVSGISATPQQNTGVLYVNTTGTYVSYAMPQISANLYSAVFPPITCGSVLSWYVSAKTTTNATVTSPSNAPAGYNSAISAVSASISYTDSFETDQGWTAGGTNPIIAEHWVRDTPVAGNAGPADDFDNSGKCWHTSLNAAIGGTIFLISPTLNATGADYNLSYARWFSNSTGGSPFSDTMVVEISNDNGGTWSPLETVGPTGPEVSGGWLVHSVRVADKVVPTNQVRVRFSLTDDGGNSTIAAGVDAFKLQLIDCSACAADFNHDGFVDGIDYDLYSNAFEAGDLSADFNGDGFVDGIDYDLFMNAFDAGC